MPPRLAACPPEILDQLCADFRCLDRHKVMRLSAQPDKITQHLAQAHDLTLSEARDTLINWFATRSAWIDQRAA